MPLCCVDFPELAAERKLNATEAMSQHSAECRLFLGLAVPEAAESGRSSLKSPVNRGCFI